MEILMAQKKQSVVKALDKQVGGQHYKQHSIQPVEFSHYNQLGFCEGTIVKYISRWREKGGIEDLKKVIHYAELLIQMETEGNLVINHGNRK